MELVLVNLKFQILQKNYKNLVMNLMVMKSCIMLLQVNKCILVYLLDLHFISVSNIWLMINNIVDLLDQWLISLDNLLKVEHAMVVFVLEKWNVIV